MRKKEVYLVAILAMLVIAIIAYKYLWMGEGGIKNIYPTYTPFTPYKKLLPRGFSGMSNDKAAKLALKYFIEHFGFNPEEIKAASVENSSFMIAIKEGSFYISIYNSSMPRSISIFSPEARRYWIGGVEIEASTKRICHILLNWTYLYRWEKYAKLPHLSKETVHKWVMKILNELGYKLDKNIKVIINKYWIFPKTKRIFIDFNITIYGYRTSDVMPPLDSGSLGILILDNKPFVFEADIPDEIIRVYELGLFVDPNKYSMISREKADKILDQHIDSIKGIVDKKVIYRDIVWFFKPISKKTYYPVPYLAYEYYYHFTFINGSSSEGWVFVDAFTGEVYWV